MKEIQSGLRKRLEKLQEGSELDEAKITSQSPDQLRLFHIWVYIWE